MHPQPTPPAPPDMRPLQRDPLCACGHPRSEHAPADTGDTRCLVVSAAALLEAFDDGRPRNDAYCACLHFREGTR